MPDLAPAETQQYVSEYLDRVMAAARLVPRDARRVRGELETHLLALLESGQSQNLSQEETWIMVQKEFGEPETLGKEIARAKGRFLTYVKRESRKFIMSLAVMAALTFAVKAYAINIYKIATDAAEPYALKHSRVLVNRLASKYRPGDLVMFDAASEPKIRIGLVKSVQPDNVIISRNSEPDAAVKRTDLIGRVFLETR